MDAIDSILTNMEAEVSPDRAAIRRQLFWCWRAYSEVANAAERMADAMVVMSTHFDDSITTADDRLADVSELGSRQSDLEYAVAKLPAVCRFLLTALSALDELEEPAELRAQRGSRRRRRRRRRPEAREVAYGE